MLVDGKTGNISDGYHTFDELYDHRITLWIALCKQRQVSWRSKVHSDGSMFEGWFVLGMGTGKGCQMTYHLPISRWDDTGFAMTMDMAPEFDGHTPAEVLKRIAAL